MNTSLRALWRLTPVHVEYIQTQIWQRFVAASRSTLLGRAWLVIQPLAMILIYTLVFSSVMHQRLGGREESYAYSLFLCSALLPWQFFTDVWQKTQTVLVDHAHVLRKTAVPLGAFFLIALGHALLNFLVIFALFVVWVLFLTNVPFSAVLQLLPLIGLEVLLAWVWGIVFAITHVFFRDAGQFLGLILQFGFWMTPVVYPLAVMPLWAQQLLLWVNPVLPLAVSEQALMIGSAWPPVWTWGVYGAYLLVGSCLAIVLMRAHAAELTDVL